MLKAFLGSSLTGPKTPLQTVLKGYMNVGVLLLYLDRLSLQHYYKSSAKPWKCSCLFYSLPCDLTYLSHNLEIVTQEYEMGTFYVYSGIIRIEKRSEIRLYHVQYVMLVWGKIKQKGKRDVFLGHMVYVIKRMKKYMCIISALSEENFKSLSRQITCADHVWGDKWLLWTSEITNFLFVIFSGCYLSHQISKHDTVAPEDNADAMASKEVGVC